MRDDFRNFRLDRILNLTVLEESFPIHPGRTLEDFLRRVGADETRGHEGTKGGEGKI